MARPDPPLYVGTTRPGPVGWTRIALTVIAGAVVVLVLALGPRPVPPVLLLAVAAVFMGLAAWTWMCQWTRFVVDQRGLTVSLGGFWPRPTWPVADFRTVQLREIPASTVGVTVGGYGWRRGRVIPARPDELRAVGHGKIYTASDAQRHCRLLVTRAGTMVEIIGRGDTDHLFSPVDPLATAEAVEQAIRAHR